MTPAVGPTVTVLQKLSLGASTMLSKQIHGACKYFNTLTKYAYYIPHYSQHLNIIHFVISGVVLYAMVSSRLPFGEDSRVQYGGCNYRNLHLDSHLSEGKWNAHLLLGANLINYCLCRPSKCTSSTSEC